MIKKLYLLIFIAIGFVACTTSQKKTKKRKPNIIVVLADDLGYNDVSFNGSTEIQTPNIDRIAKNGVKFTNGYVSYSVCGPSRAGLITGRYQDRFGGSRNPLFAPKDINQGLPLSEETLATTLSKENYKSIALGKWHLGAHEKLRPLKRGFNEFFGFLTGGHQYFPENMTLNDLSELNSQYDAYKTKLLKNNNRVDEKEYLTDAISREAVSFIDKNKDNPFFMYLAYNAPHAPMQATKKYLDRFPHIKNKKRKTYAAMVSAVDDGVGKLLDKLQELNIDENTLVFFLSDNGGPETHNASDNGKLRGQKGTMFEGGIRVPFALQWPGTIPKGTVYHKPIISLDIFATAVAVSNATPKNKLDGVNIIPYITGNKKDFPHKTLYWRSYDANIDIVRKGDYKWFNNNGNINLYNLAKDIGEQNSLTQKELNQREDWTNEFNSWEKQMIAPIYEGLSQNEQYNKEHPDRFKNVEKY